MKKRIHNPQELEFAVFCIESVAHRLGVPSDAVFRALAEKSRILYDCILPSYDILHTQSKDYIVSNILDVVSREGINFEGSDTL